MWLALFPESKNSEKYVYKLQRKNFFSISCKYLPLFILNICICPKKKIDNENHFLNYISAHIFIFYQIVLHMLMFSLHSYWDSGWTSLYIYKPTRHYKDCTNGDIADIFGSENEDVDCSTGDIMYMNTMFLVLYVW